MMRCVTRLAIALVTLFWTACSNSTTATDLSYEDDVSLLPPDILTKIPPSGFYTNPFIVQLSDSSLHCEKGGTLPTAESPAYSILSVSSPTTLRCISIENGIIKGNELIRTYVFRNPPTIATVFITADPGSLFDPDTGIYELGPNAQEEQPFYGANFWLDKEIPVFVELLENGSKEPAFAKKAGLEIFGGYSRWISKKSIAITFRKEYGDNRLRHPLFPEFPRLKKFKSFVLRNNGNNSRRDYIRDYLASSICDGLDIDYQKGRFAIVYYNGKYYGIHQLRERSNKYFFETNYGIDPDDIDLLKADDSVSAGTSTDYVSLVHWLESHNLNVSDNYNYVASQIDINNYINYIHAELFSDNRDWPANNLKKWRNTRPVTKWRFFLYDLDFGFGHENSYTNNIFEFATEQNGEYWPNGPKFTLLLRKLLENDSFKTSFINRMSVLLNMNFESERVLNRIDRMMAEIETEIPLDQKRWDLNASKMDSELETIKNFARNRPNIVFKEMHEFFKLSEPAEVILSVDGRGEICVHDLPLDRSSLTIQFFKGLPVTLRAQSKNGGVFVGWNDGEKDVIRTIMPENTPSLTALFK